jgi:hypothetical protein
MAAPTPESDPSLVPPAAASVRVRRAAARAAEDARDFYADPSSAWPGAAGAWGAGEAGPAAARSRRLAIGDPQAPLSTFLEILDRNDLLADDGRLHREVFLVSLGDHFDWGPAEERVRGAESAVRLLAWLGAHPADQVLLLAGNHDLARVGELATYDDALFADAHAEASALRRIPLGQPGRFERREAYLARHRALPSVGVAARDWAQFEARQRTLVASLLRAGRFRAAWAAAPDLLLVHGAVTPDDLAPLGLEGSACADADRVAAAVQGVFAPAVAGLREGVALDLEPLYRIGDAARGESRGIFVQRPADPARGEEALFEGPPRRRFDPRRLAPGLAQVTGHIRDQKCRELMPDWSADDHALDGPLRHLWTDGRTVRYARGLPPDGARAGQARGEAALIYFGDGGMNHAPAERYELFDLDARRGVSAAGRVG